MAGERSKRSIFVGNIPHESGEEELKKFFGQVGPVVSFRIMHDKESGKSKGYGFCEYHDKETAQVAMKNLNNVNFNGRQLRVGEASGGMGKESGKEKSSSTPTAKTIEPEVVESCTETIDKAISSLGHDKLVEILREVQNFIRDHHDEARELLVSNPQLAYALVQIQVALNLITPTQAKGMYHQKIEDIPPIMPEEDDDVIVPQHMPTINDQPLSEMKILETMTAPEMSVSDPARNHPRREPNYEHFETFPSVMPPPDVRFAPQGIMNSPNMMPYFGQPPTTTNGHSFGIDMAPSKPTIPGPGFRAEPLNQGFVDDRFYGPGRDFDPMNQGQRTNTAYNERANQHFDENQYRHNRDYRQGPPAVGPQSHGIGENHRRPNRDFHAGERDDPRQFVDNSYRPNRDFRPEGQFNPRYVDNHHVHERDFINEERAAPRFVETQYRQDRDFQMDHQNSRGADFGDDRYRPIRGRDHARSTRYATKPYDSANPNGRRQGFERQEGRPRQRSPVGTRDAPRYQEPMPAPAQSYAQNPEVTAMLFNLSEDQIANLPPEQRNCILALKEHMQRK